MFHLMVVQPMEMTIISILFKHGKNHHPKVIIPIIVEAKPYQPYGDVNSSYKAHYPGHKPQMR